MTFLILVSIAEVIIVRREMDDFTLVLILASTGLLLLKKFFPVWVKEGKKWGHALDS